MSSKTQSVIPLFNLIVSGFTVVVCLTCKFGKELIIYENVDWFKKEGVPATQWLSKVGLTVIQILLD